MSVTAKVIAIFIRLKTYYYSPAFWLCHLLVLLFNYMLHGCLWAAYGWGCQSKSRWYDMKSLWLINISSLLVCLLSGSDWADNVGGDEARQQHHSALSHIMCNASSNRTVNPRLSSSTQYLLLPRVRARYWSPIPLLQNIIPMMWHMLQPWIGSIFPAPVSGTCVMQI